MELNLNPQKAPEYNSASQRIRILTEDWVDRVIFCPNCGNLNIDKFPNNSPVADFLCTRCLEEYELKSKSKAIGPKIVDGAYSTMLERLQSSNNPNFFFLTYNPEDLLVSNFMVIPKHFFIPEIIEKRNPLSSTARRAGWVGCNILLNNIPESGKIFYIKDGRNNSAEEVLEQWQKTLFLRGETELSAKGWLLDVMRCIDKLDKKSFSLSEVYMFEAELQKLHPENRHVKDKIRQQLQVLRDSNYLRFTTRGNYELL